MPELKLHPDFQCGFVDAIGVQAERPRPGLLRLRFSVTGRIAGLRIPPPTEPRRKDDLWRRTCFEAFLRPGPGPDYLELNLSLSGEWQAYSFEAPRSGRREAAVPPPRIATQSSASTFTLEAEIGGLPDGLWSLNLAAVIEEVDGRVCYWALAHPAGAPDFHHPDCFALHLPPPA
jgi:hypothetical protein